MKKFRFGEFLSEFRLNYNLTENDLAGLYPLKDRHRITALQIHSIEQHKFKDEKLAIILDDLISSMTTFEQDIPESHKFINERKMLQLRQAAKDYVSPRPAFERNIVGVPKEEMFKNLCGVVNIPYLCNQLNIAPGSEPKNLPDLLKAVRKFLGYSQRALMEEKGDKHSVTYHKMEKDAPHNPSHEFVESLIAFISKKMQTRSFRDVVECMGSKSIAVGLATNTRSEKSFDFEILTHNRDFSRVHPVNGCHGVISLPSNENRIDPQSHFVKAYRMALKNIINNAGGPNFYESAMVRKALDQTVEEMRRKFPGLKVTDNIEAHQAIIPEVATQNIITQESVVQ